MPILMLTRSCQKPPAGPKSRSMNRRQRRAELAVARREKRVLAYDYDFPALAADTGLPVDILKTMATAIPTEAIAELQPAHNDLPALAKTDPVRVTEFVGSYTDTWFRHDGGPAIACRAGCAHCCFIVPEVTRDEATVLQAAIAGLPEAARLKVMAAIVTAAAAVRAAGGDAHAAWPLRCPLLGEDNCCQVYDQRPGACRAWASTDAAACAAATGADDTVPTPPETAMARASLRFLHTIFELGAVQPLPLALEGAAADAAGGGSRLG
jgi:Fe-S-cluster containining protein